MDFRFQAPGFIEHLCGNFPEGIGGYTVYCIDKGILYPLPLYIVYKKELLYFIVILHNYKYYIFLCFVQFLQTCFFWKLFRQMVFTNTKLSFIMVLTSAKGERLSLYGL